METVLVLFILSVVLSVPLIMHFVPIGLWLSAMVTGAGISISRLVAMRLRGAPAEPIVVAHITAVKGGLEVPLDALEEHQLAGGSAEKVVMALFRAKRDGIDLDFTRAAAMDLAGDKVTDHGPSETKAKLSNLAAAEGVSVVDSERDVRS